MIKLLNVNKSYGDKLVLQNINLDIKKGTVLGVVGPNGSGKSTILRLLAGVMEADAGMVSMNDENIFDHPYIKEKIVFLADDPYFPLQSTLRNMKNYYQIFYPTFDEAYYYELLEEFPIDENEKLSDFSKGMKRQATLILAMASRPEIMILDETFDGLDPIMRFKLKQFIVDGITENNMTFIISSHILFEIESICDNVILIDKQGFKISESINDLYRSYTRFQVVFDAPPADKTFLRLQALSIEGNQRIYNIIMKGDRDDNLAQIEKLKPIIVESSELSLEEIYRYEVKGDQ